MVFSYGGKVALITGGAQGLGKAFALALLHRGCRASLVDINKRLGKETEKEFLSRFGENSTVFYECDVSNKAQLESAFKGTREHFGGLDIVINNAGIVDEINWEKTIQIDLNAVIHGTYLAVETMNINHSGQGGIVINVSSLSGMVATPAAPAYTAAKHGIIGFTRSLAETVAPPPGGYGIKFCVLCPSFAHTEMLNSLYEQKVPHEWKTSYKTLKRGVQSLGTMHPEDVVKGMFTLIEEDRSHGAVLVVTPAGLEYKFPMHLKGKL